MTTETAIRRAIETADAARATSDAAIDDATNLLDLLTDVVEYDRPDATIRPGARALMTAV